MNRRSFLQIIAAAAALPFAPKIKLTPGPRRLTYEGFTFIEDPDPLRFILTPEGYVTETIEYAREYAGTWEPNPAYATALQPLIAFHPDAVRRWEGQGPQVAVKVPTLADEIDIEATVTSHDAAFAVWLSDLNAVAKERGYKVPFDPNESWRNYWGEGFTPREALDADESNA
jgi:hypothetical protein